MTHLKGRKKLSAIPKLRNLKGAGKTLLFVIHIENPTRCNSVSKFYFIFI